LWRVPSPDAGILHLGVLSVATIPSVQSVTGLHHARFIQSVFTRFFGQRRLRLCDNSLVDFETPAMPRSPGVVALLSGAVGARAWADGTPALPERSLWSGSRDSLVAAAGGRTYEMEYCNSE